jgi:aryl-alcohol dehydrogenase-like predicted oxidoreductase
MVPRFSPRRALGRTGFVATAIGIGDLADRSAGLETCVSTLRRALEAGLNLVDTAPSYEDGFSEEVVGNALRGRREGVFVVDKVDHLDRSVAPQVDKSIAALGFTPDLFVFHNVSKLDVWNALAAPGGGMSQLGELVRAGKCRFRGVSAHHPDVVRAAIDSGLCDVVMFAVGPSVDRRYVDELLPRARAANVGVIGFKCFGAGMLLGDTAGYGKPLDEPRPNQPRLTVEECVRATLTLDPDVALLGLSTPEEQDAALSAASTFRPMSREELDAVRTRAASAIDDKGPRWWDPSTEPSAAGARS